MCIFSAQNNDNIDDQRNNEPHNSLLKIKAEIPQRKLTANVWTHTANVWKHTPQTCEHTPQTYENTPQTYEHSPQTYEHSPWTCDYCLPHRCSLWKVCNPYSWKRAKVGRGLHELDRVWGGGDFFRRTFCRWYSVDTSNQSLQRDTSFYGKPTVPGRNDHAMEGVLPDGLKCQDKCCGFEKEEPGPERERRKNTRAHVFVTVSWNG